MREDRPAWLFAGPTTVGLPPRLLARVRCCAPVRRGDLPRLVDEHEPGAIVLCDGVFQAAPAVAHAEIALALDAGWQVHGVGSIGAIRAWEMRRHGMQGWGWVYRCFARHRDFTDDELCLLHLPEPPWLALSEPLVNLRHALAERGPALGIGAAAARRVVAELQPLWFGDRSLPRMHAALVGAGRVDDARAAALLRWMQRRRIKTLDLAELLRRAPWRG